MKSSQNCQGGIDVAATARTTRAGSVRCGFTLIEMILVVVILAIAAMVAVPFATSGATMQLKSAANIIASDLEFAKSMAISRGRIYSVVFNDAGESYQIEDVNGVIMHPVNVGSTYVVNFANDSRLDQVDITSANFDATPTVMFDYLGSPYNAGGLGSPLNSGVVSLSAGGSTLNVNVEPVTGYISISE